MTYLEIGQRARIAVKPEVVLPALLAAMVVCAYIPTLRSLADGPWQTEQEGHGPLIIAASLWLMWMARKKIHFEQSASAPVVGWLVLVFGLLMLFFSRTQDVLSVEVLSLLPVISGCILLAAGWPAFRALAFPVGFLFFSVPAPDWMIDAATVPLKVLISDLVTSVLYAAGYPVAQNGVMIMIGTFQLLVKDACSGMNSIFALSAIGVFYVHAFRRDERLRSLFLLLAIVPITIAANFVRVLALVLVSYYGGVDLIEGEIHGLTGIALFVVAVGLLFVLDACLGICIRAFRGARIARATAAKPALA